GTQIELMRSGEVQARARERVKALRPELSPGPVSLSVNQTPRTSIFVFQATGHDPRYVEAYLNAVLHSFINFKDDMRSETSGRTQSAINEQLFRLEQELKTAQEKLFDFQKNNDVVVLQEQGNVAAGYLTNLERELADKRREARLLEMLTLDQTLERRGAALGGREESNGPDGTGTLIGQRPESEYLKAQKEIQLLRTQFNELSRNLKPRHPKLIKLREDIDRQENLLELFRSQGLEQMRNERESLLIQIKNLEETRTEWEARALQTNRLMAEYSSLKANVDRIKNLYERLLDTTVGVDVSTGISQADMSILDQASPAVEIKPSLGKALGTGVVIGLVLGLGILLVVDRFDDRIRSFTEFGDYFDDRVVGHLPDEGRIQSRQQLLGPGIDRQIYSEAIRNIRSALLFMPHGGSPPKTLMVASAIPGEGKSTVAANLAITMALSGSKVLLVDGDLRKGILHEMFGVPSAPGLTDVLAETTEWGEAVQRTAWEGLDLMVRGPTTAGSGELLLRDVFSRMLEEARGRYDFVIFDTSPVLAADDSPSMAPRFDGILHVTRADFTSARLVDRSLSLLKHRQGKIVGIVLNAVSTKSPDYYHYRYYREYQAKEA
ncbi:MAG: polysaccharide biosynthesis tyrosine autokinase, partial [Verrucomicrobiia bacterium]